MRKETIMIIGGPGRTGTADVESLEFNVTMMSLMLPVSQRRSVHPRQSKRGDRVMMNVGDLKVCVHTLSLAGQHKHGQTTERNAGLMVCTKNTMHGCCYVCTAYPPPVVMFSIALSKLKARS